MKPEDYNVAKDGTTATVWLDPNSLFPHPRNEEFTSKMEPEQFENLKLSIKNEGILHPIVTTTDRIILSGHERCRAAIELGKELVPVHIEETIAFEDQEIACLIGANIQKAEKDPLKRLKCIQELERIRGVKHGGIRQASDDNSHLTTQEDIANELGITVSALRETKKLSKLIPEFQQAVSDRRIGATTGTKRISRLSEHEQHQLIETLPEGENFTDKQIAEYIERIQTLEARNDKLTKDLQKRDEETIAIAALKNFFNDRVSGLSIALSYGKERTELIKLVKTILDDDIQDFYISLLNLAEEATNLANLLKEKRPSACVFDDEFEE